ncbi:TPA: response regulator [Burkholderia aenigmatica]|uniref:response regulator n=1 Tax=Burkholderia sp. AU45251 TaxID=3059204 RepID=UPI00264CCA79|nr:response regulator [Burkholderia sp. AU45251]HDR9480868.1 response regulator [Burkholderia aenigmatica]MDN7514519.1 response regulator [Burkholderia sp. AU45251]HDR9517609.1 response regulator [Burkholderia aenigmatica]HDR9594476.1 response regulator [Burkholderia aenigmatica]HDR9605188.1 response regulator [Burkholderia aenigmatica]
MSIRVVIADDHPLMLYGIRHALASETSISVVGEALEPGALLSCIARTHCDVVVTDFAMPGRAHADGLLMLEAIREAFPLVRVVVLTMLDNPALMQNICNTGVLTVLNKRGVAADLARAIVAAHAGRPFLPAVRPMPTAVNDDVYALSPREIEVVRMCASGMTMTDIAHYYGRSIKTISTQKHNAMKKLGIRSDAELFLYVSGNGLA